MMYVLIIPWSLGFPQHFRSSGGKRWAEVLFHCILPLSCNSWEQPTQWHRFHPGTSAVQLFAIPHPDGWRDRGTAEHRGIWCVILHACHCGHLIATQDFTAGTRTLRTMSFSQQERFGLQQLKECYERYGLHKFEWHYCSVKIYSLAQ